MPLPEFREDGWLPEGRHSATWDEITAALGGIPLSRRASVFSDLLRWRDALRAKGISGILVLDGSFVSRKPDPADFDCIFVYDESAKHILASDAAARELISYSRCKEEYRADVFTFSVTDLRDHPTFCRTEGFDHEKVTRIPKGVIEVPI